MKRKKKTEKFKQNFENQEKLKKKEEAEIVIYKGSL